MARKNKRNRDELVDALRISDAEWYECVKEMDLQGLRHKCDNERRDEPRHAYRHIGKIIVSMRNYDGRLQNFEVRAYNLSKLGLGFLHGAYIYEGMPVDLLMHHSNNGPTIVPATIVSCVHVKKRIHHVGAKFDEPIELGDYLLNEAG